MPFNNTSLVGDLSVVFTEVDAAWEGHRVLLVALRGERVSLGNCVRLLFPG